MAAAIALMSGRAQAQPTPSACASVAELSQYDLVYEYAVPLTADYDYGLPVYDVDDAASWAGASISRVGYCFQLDDQWIWTSMDAFTAEPTQLGVPVAATGAVFQQPVSHLNVRSNVADIVDGDDISTGNIEFWSNCYERWLGLGAPGGDDLSYDFDDYPTTPSCYGSMQVHNYGAGQTLFAYNRWDAGGASDVGIGNSSSVNSDWTFTQNAGDYSTRNLKVYVRAAQTTPTANAGPDRSVMDRTLNTATTVILDGSASSDPRHRPLTYQWTQVSGPSVVLDTSDPAKPKFVALDLHERPDGEPAQVVLVFRLTVRAGADTSLEDDVTITVMRGELPTPSACSSVAELSQYDLVYEYAVPLTADYNGGRPVYDVDDSARWSRKSFSRVGYCFQLDGQWIWTSMDAFTTDPTQLGVPVAATGAAFQQKVSHLNVRSNVRDVVSDDDISTGNIEFWSNCYERWAGLGLPGTDDSSYDFDDNWTTPSCYGSMQVHDYGARQTLFAYNRWDAGGASDVGIGNSSSVNADWTFTQNAGNYSTRNLKVYVLVAQTTPTANAGPDRSVMDRTSNTATMVTLDGSASSDPRHRPLTYQWTQVSGPSVVLDTSDPAKPKFVAPDLREHPDGEPGPVVLVFRLIVRSGADMSLADDVTITVTHDNLPPEASASVPPSAAENEEVILDASGSSDPDGDSLAFTWTQTAGPAVQLLSNAGNDPQTRFTHEVIAPHCVKEELLSFILTANDGIAQRDSQVVSTRIRNRNRAPSASAGVAQTVCESASTVTLSGAGSDPDGDAIAQYAWTQVGGPAVTLVSAQSANASFVPPAVSAADQAATLTFKLSVSDACDADDAAALVGHDTLDITVKHENRAPIADAGREQRVPELQRVTLDGSASFDPDGDAIASYTWTQTGGEPVTLLNPNSATPSFIANDVSTGGDRLTFELTVTDAVNGNACGQSQRSAVSTTVVNVQYVNNPPTASAGAALSGDEGALLALHGSGTDADGNPLTYSWTQLSGPTVALDTTDPANPTFTAPEVPCGGASAVFELTVDDGFDQDRAQTSVMILNQNHLPVARAGTNLSVPEQTSVLLNASLVTDLDGEPVSLSWRQLAGPAVELVDGNTAHPGFSAPLVTGTGDPNASVTLSFELAAQDTCGGKSTDVVEVKVTNVDHGPIARAGGAQAVCEGHTVTLNGAGSSDPDDDALLFSWSQISGAAVTLAGSGSAAASFVAPAVGPAGATLAFKLMVDDGFGGTNTDTAQITVLDCNTPPTCSAAKASAATLWPPNHQMQSVSVVGIADPDGNASVTITKVTQDEPISGLGDGDTGPDAILDGSSVLLRAERAGTGNGRVYHAYFTAADAEGTCSGMVKVSVPRDKKGDVAVDGGELFLSTGP